MKIVKPLTLGLLHKPYRFRGSHHLCIAALGFFRLGQENERFLTENLQWPLVAPLLPPGHPLDALMPKVHSEVLLSGSAHAPDGKSVCDMTVRLCVGGVDKRLRVLGTRRWRYRLVPLLQVDRPAPFTSMPLVYERAFGGPSHPANPVGCGYTGQRLGALFGVNEGDMPNLEYAGAAVNSPVRQMAPAGFGPLDMGWSPRKERHGTYDQRWLERDAPGLPDDVDWSLFNAAPQDQWLPTPLAGGECYRLEGMHPTLPVLEGRLPAHRVRAFAMLASGGEAQEVPMRMDTVWFFPEHALGVLVYHGQCVIGDSDALDVDALMVGYEDPGAERSEAIYRAVFAQRLAPATALLCAFNESQLATARSPAHQELRAQGQLEQEAIVRARQQAVLDELYADFWQTSGMAPPEGHNPPAPPPGLPLLTQESLEESDFDLAETVAQAEAMAAAARAEGEQLLAKAETALADLPQPARPAPERREAMLERASIPAYDMLPPERRQLDPRLHELAALMDPEADREGLFVLAAQRRKARQVSPEASAPALPITPENALWLGRQVRQWHAGGAFLAGRDLAGIDLAGADLSGADLREAMFERADLRGANFDGANLAGAVLTGALLDGASFAGADLSGANLCQTHAHGASFAGALLARAQVTGASWPQARLPKANLDNLLALSANLEGACLDGATLRGATLLGVVAPGSSWRGCVLEQTILSGARLDGADFSGATLYKAVLLDGQLAGSIWHGAHLKSVAAAGKSDWRGAQLQGALADGCGWHGATLAGADLSDGHFLRCDFGRCNLDGANLERALFSSSLFMRASLRRVCGRDADFFQALCRKADFTGADLSRANLVQVEMGDASFTGCRLDDVRLDPQRRLA